MGFYADGRPGEVFITVDEAKRSSPLEYLIKDAAVAISLALQYGCPPDTLGKAFLRTVDSEPETIFGLIMDMVKKES